MIMKKTIEIVLDENDITQIIKHHIMQHNNLDVKNLRFSTGIRGDFDKGNAKEYIKRVYCECDEI